MEQASQQPSSPRGEPEQGGAAGPAEGRSRRVALALLLYAAHLALVVYACPSRVFFGDEPLMGVDYQTHYEQTLVVNEALRRFGKTWAYDPNMLAGDPAGLIFDVDNKAHSLFAYLLTALGVRPPVAFNLFPLLIHLLAPLAIWLAARVLRTGPRAQLVSLALAVLLWHFDSAVRWFWWAGMISFATVAVASPLVVALFHRLLEERALRWRLLLPFAALLTLLLLVHVWAFATLVAPLAVLYLRAWPTLDRRRHAVVWSAAALAVAGNLFWLWPALQHLDLVSFSGKVGQAHPLHLLADYFDIFTAPVQTGLTAPRTFFRFAALVGAVSTLWVWRRERDRRLLLGVIGLCWLLGLAYLASLLPVLRETEPYRFVLPALFLTAVLAGPCGARLLERGWVRELGPTARAALLLLLVLVVPRLVRQVIFFIPELYPDNDWPSVPKDALKPTEAAPELLSARQSGVPQDYRDVAAYLRRHCSGEGRVLVEWWQLGEYLRWAQGHPIIGGFPDRRTINEAANLFRYRLDRRYYGPFLADYLVRYNVRYLVISNPYVAIETRGDLLEFQQLVGRHRIYRARHRGDYFAAGNGTVRASLNRIAVEGAQPQPGTQRLVLRFHYLRTLRCRPDCALERFALPDNPTGFLTVRGTPRLPARFVIENSYRP